MKLRGLVVILLALAQTALVSAGEQIHTVSPGESISAIAKRYYGEYELVDLLLTYNQRQSTVIQPGERLRIPYCEVHRIEPGDSWSLLAQRYLGKISVYPAIARLNGLSPDEPLQLGRDVVIPIAVPYRLSPGDTLAGLALQFYEETDRSDVLQVFNDIEDSRRLSVGRLLEIPLTGVFLREEVTQTAEATAEPAEPAPPVEPDSRFDAELLEARKTFDRGEYVAARELLESLRGPVETEGATADRIEFLRLVAFVSIAFDLPEQACVAYGSLVEQSAVPDLDADFVSPKIRAALAACGAGS